MKWCRRAYGRHSLLLFVVLIRPPRCITWCVVSPTQWRSLIVVAVINPFRTLCARHWTVRYKSSLIWRELRSFTGWFTRVSEAGNGNRWFMQIVRPTFDSTTRCKRGRTTPDSRPTLSCRSTLALALSLSHTVHLSGLTNKNMLEMHGGRLIDGCE